MKAAICLLFACFVLSACVSTAEKDARECGAGGERPGSALYEDCMRYAQVIRNSQAQQHRQRSSESFDRYSRSLTAMGQRQEEANSQAQQRFPVRCTSNRYGNQVNTTCY